MDEILSLIVLGRLEPPIGPSLQLKLLRHFGTARNIFLASEAEVRDAFPDLRPEQLSRLKVGAAQASLDAADRLWQRLQADGVRVLSIADKDYPERLLNTHVPPPVLYVRGDVSCLNQRAMIAVVGSRRATDYGERVMKHLVPELVAAGAVIVSGLAFGMDAAAHQACLKASGLTVAVQAMGVDAAVPRAHQTLYEQVLQQGSVVSEFPLAEGRIEKSHFPRRNRIISGLADGVIVVEAGEKSGALITARYALEQNREVFAAPGSIFSEASRGCLNLIRQGAHPVSCAADVIAAMPRVFPAAAVKLAGVEDRPSLQPELLVDDLEKKLITLCRTSSRTLDDLVEMTGDSAAAVFTAATRLELLGALRSSAGGRFGTA